MNITDAYKGKDKMSFDIGSKFIDNNIGKIYKVLFENRDEEYWTGLTDNYIKVHVKPQLLEINLVLSF